ncbi:MAG: septation protein A [Pelagibacteraceae bacterium]|jgi:intracellular septation protein|nr:septation protein A [Pelagibacteraceae bacterium]MBO6466697.1 septation protein A [Pelagibacteraceae bacterium]MBO6467965.1 septation protein A [Pelagibacteraceae bacterium]MBO6469764.1 septation protein A [Pelagibacteraceae bacterium]
MKSIFKLLIDIGPLAVFFIFYTRSDLKTAILPFMIATTIAVLFSYIIEKKIPIMPTVGAVIILIFGGLTIYFDNETFFKMKPTIINLLFAGILYGGIILNKSLLRYLLGAALKLQDEGWDILTKRWIGFFIALAILNEIVWRTQTTDIWVNFKVFGILPITFIFTLTQFSTIKKYQVED